MLVQREIIENLECVTLNLVYYATGWITGEADSTTGVLSGDGIAENVVRDMQKMLDFRINLTNLGYKNPASKDYFESGIGKLLQNGKADIAIEYLYLTPARVQLASPLHPIIMDGLFALFVQPKSSIVRNIYLDPLPPAIWIVWFSALFSIYIWGMLLQMIIRNTNSFIGLLKALPKMITDALFLTVATASQSGQVEENVASITSLSILNVTSNILSLSVYFVFSARLLAVILEPTYPIQKWEDLIDSGFSFYYPPSFHRFVTQHERFSEMDLKRFDSTEDVWSKSVEAIFSEKHARIDIGFGGAGGTQWKIRIEEFRQRSENNFCDLISSVQIQKSNFGFSNAFYVAKTSPLKNVLNKSILRIKESGLLKRYMNHPTLPRMLCAPSIKSSYHEDLGLDDVGMNFFMLIVLSLCSSIILGLEFCVMGI